MSQTQKLSQNQSHFINRFTISFEIVLIYIATGLIVLTFFESIRVFFYATLGYIALFMFLSVFVVMVAYIIYNFYRIAYALAKR